jgi:hypothetical protein
MRALRQTRALGLMRSDGYSRFDRNAEMAFTSNIRPIAPAGSMRNSRRASAGRAISKPQATAPTVPAPRPLKSNFIVRLRGKPPLP